MKRFPLVILLATGTACGPALSGGAGGGDALTVLAKNTSNDGSAWGPWRRTAEHERGPVYILIAHDNRACLVDHRTFIEIAIGSPHICRWRFPRPQ